MKQNKLGTYISTFTEEDWASFHKFSKSIFTYNSDFQLIINYIKKHKARFNPTFIDAEFLRKKIRPQASKQVFANVISNLCKHIEQYFIWAEVESDTMMRDTLLLQAIGKRGLNEQFHKLKKKSKEKRDKLPVGLWHNYHDFMSEYLLYYCNMLSDNHDTKIALQETYREIKAFSSTIIGYLNLEMSNRSVVLKEDWEENLNEIARNYSGQYALKPTIDHLTQMKVHKSVDSFNYLLKAVENPMLSVELRYTIIVHLRSFITHKTIKGDNSYNSILMELQKYGLAKNILFPSGRIPIPSFINIVNRACAMKEYLWAEEFIEKFSANVQNTNIKATKTLGKAQIESSKKNYSLVLQLLANTKYKNFEQEIRAKWLILSSNYELNKDNFEIIENNIINFKNFISRNKNRTTQLAVLSLLNTSKYLLYIAKGINLESVKNKILTEKNLFFRKWLLNKINDKIKVA